MSKKIFGLGKLLPLMLFAGVSHCNNNAPNPSAMADHKVYDTIGVTIEWYVDKDGSLSNKNANARVIAKGYNWSEGPVWVDEMDMLLFSDVPENKIYKWTKDKGAQLYLAHSGFTDTLAHPDQDGSNGLATDTKRRLVICQSGARQVSRMNSNLDSPANDFTILANSYKGKKFNSPNDLVIDHRGNIYFTDPVYGLPGKEKDPSRELNFEGIFRISPGGSVNLLIDSIPKPNGITLSPDEKTLYIASSDEKRPAWYAYRIDSSGNILSGGLLLAALALREKATIKQSPDGLKADNFGNIFGAGPDGISIISASGKLIGLIKVPGRYTSNCSFNNSRDILYITADDLILQLILHPVVPE